MIYSFKIPYSENGIDNFFFEDPLRGQPMDEDHEGYEVVSSHLLHRVRDTTSIGPQSIDNQLLNAVQRGSLDLWAKSSIVEIFEPYDFQIIEINGDNQVVFSAQMDVDTAVMVKLTL